jgi:exodeoxyribonuclease V gamma subunit
MLQTYHSNRMECLVDELIHQIQSPLSNPMRPETIVIQNPGMERWLSQQIASSTGIAANLDFPLPASFVWRIYQWWMPGMPDQAGFDRDSMKWHIMGLLPQNIETRVFAPLARYLLDDEHGIRAYQLSGRIADLFDQYLVFRPDMLLAWEQGRTVGDSPDEQWQANLWRKMVAATSGGHRAALFDHFRSLQANEQPPVTELPERVSVFGLAALAPVYLHALQALAAHTQVHLYLLNPCREYWADIQDDKGLARRRGRWRQSGKEDVSALLDVGNPLLASMGQLGQVFVDQLLDLDAGEQDLFEPPDQHSLLGQVQQDILELQDRRMADQSALTMVEQDDLSIQIHSCHSPMREVQVLHDQLRQLFDRMPKLQAREVVVMAPDIGIYAPYVQAVFGAAGGDRYIPWSLADLGPQQEAPLLGALSELLQLPGFRFEASRVISLLEVPAIAARFDMDEEGLEHVRCWVTETAVRWGADGDMRAGLGLPAESANTWDTGLERMFQGYALPVDAGLQQDILPYADIEGSDAVYLGKLAALIECLQQWQSRLSAPMEPAAWVATINQLLVDFFAPAVEEEPLLQAVRSAMDSMLEHCQANEFTTPLSLDIVRGELQQALEAISSGAHFLQGGVTFCNMVPMRSIPFSVVCLLGMNDKDYPRREQPVSFDLMAASPRPADRSRRMDDRYLFLEALLSARDVFYLSYTGRSVKDNSIKVPSVVLSELLDYLGASFKPAQGDKLQDQLLTMHPLQPFSHRYFNASDPRLFSYDAGWLAAADSQEPGLETPFVDAALAVTESVVAVELTDLVRFILNPAGWFLTRCLGVTKIAAEDSLQDAEPFALDSLTAYQLSTQLLEEIRQGTNAGEYLPLAIAGGELPHGHVGEIAFSNQTDSLDELADRIGKYAGVTAEPLEVDLRIGKFHLTGWMDQLDDKGLLSYRPASLKPKDRLRLWVKHLVLCALLDSDDVKSVHVASDKTQVFERVDDPLDKLMDLLQAWQQGQQSPLPFFPAASLEFIEKKNDLDKARKKWQADHDSGLNNWFVQVAFRGGDPLAEQEFLDWTARLAAPLVAASSIIPAKDDS